MYCVSVRPGDMAGLDLLLRLVRTSTIGEVEHALSQNPLLVIESNYDGLSVLHIAAEARDPSMVRMLIDRGANVRENHIVRLYAVWIRSRR